MGKYLTTSYEIFQGSYKPDQAKISAATNYFVNLIKKTNKKYKNVKEGVCRRSAADQWLLD